MQPVWFGCRVLLTELEFMEHDSVTHAFYRQYRLHVLSVANTDRGLPGALSVGICTLSWGSLLPKLLCFMAFISAPYLSPPAESAD